MGPELLDRALAAIASERGGSLHGGSELVRLLVADYGEADLAERLYRDIPIDCPWEVVADLFNILVWNTSDNGSRLCHTAARWLEANDDLRRIQIALYMGIFPYASTSEVTRVLDRVAACHPEVADRCRELTETRSQGMTRRFPRMRFSRPSFEGSDGA
jgi:hypothetical protein